MSILVAALIDQSQLLADKRSDPSIGPTDWLTFVNWSVEALWRFVTALDPNLYFAQSDFTLTGGVSGNTFDLMSIVSGGVPQFRALHGLDLFPDTANRRTVPSRNFRERNIGAIGPWIPSALATDRAYDIRGRILNVLPYEIAAGTYRVYYRKKPYAFTGTGDTNPLDSELEQWSEWIPISAAMKGLDQEETDTTPLASRLADLRQQITDAYARDDGSPSVIADVERDLSTRWW